MIVSVVVVIWGLRYKNLSIVAGPHILHTQVHPAPGLVFNFKIRKKFVSNKSNISIKA